ncbi:amino acid ABC transporter permease [Xinfangfangia sp. D13-10-4-6]|uniref:amino acid ABC transporter permease n=1 Tax=Pseudogemmobacter hezensis TaxID=2737662 RepID=UPI001C130054|nr:amino acid ABC transporter permease [Pseudogemmobacter hezensis]NPD16058.1 amino acid ABC transporter permease [Pseudogemmobacter hezensis]
MMPLNLAQFEYLAHGALWTVGLSLIAFVGGSVLGFIVALGRISTNRLIRLAAATWIQIIQGTPLLVLLFLLYFGIAILGFDKLPAIISAGAALTVYSSAFLAEIWRGCLQSVPKTQWEAADCLGLNRFQRMFQVILPQALKIATPPTVGFLVQIIKNTSLASVIGFIELAQAGKVVNNAIFEPLPIFLIVACFYFAMCFPLSMWSRSLERKLHVGSR